MFVFRQRKKEEEKKESSCACSHKETVEVVNTDDDQVVCRIKVLGSGCKSCHTLWENVNEAVKAMELPAAIEFVSDMEKVMAYGVMSTPALVVNEKVVSMGKVLKGKEIEKLLQKLK